MLQLLVRVSADQGEKLKRKSDSLTALVVISAEAI